MAVCGMAWLFVEEGKDGEHRFVNSCGGEEASKGNGMKSNLHYHTHITLRSHK